MAQLDCSLPANVSDDESLRLWIGQTYPALLDPKVRIAFDDVLVTRVVPTAGVREVAFLPPVSGG